MSVLYGEDQRAIGTETRRVLEARFDKDALNALIEKRGEFDQQFWNTCVEQGWTGISIPEEHGGLGLGMLEQGIVAEACGAFLVGAPFLTTSYGVSQALVRHGSEGQKSEWLPKLASGEVIGAVAISETGFTAPSQPGVIFSGGKLKGTKPAVSAGGKADVAIVLAKGETGPALVIAKLDDGVERNIFHSFDNTRLTADLHFDGAPAELLAEGDGAVKAAVDLLARMSAVVAHEQTGAAEALMTQGRDYALERKAFGQVIGSFQSVKHRIAELYTLVEISRANAIHAAARESESDFLKWAAVARLSGLEAYDTAARDVIQIHGGIGVTWEAGLHLHQRRARTLAVETGQPYFWENVLADILVGENS